MAFINHPYQCGCDDCYNPSAYAPAGNGGPCCQYCSDAPCEYLILWGCDLPNNIGGRVCGSAFNLAGYLSGTQVNPFHAHYIHVLRRECIVDNCNWTSHGNLAFSGSNPPCYAEVGTSVVPTGWFTDDPVGLNTLCQPASAPPYTKWRQFFPPVRWRTTNPGYCLNGTQSQVGTGVGTGSYRYDSPIWGCLPVLSISGTGAWSGTAVCYSNPHYRTAENLQGCSLPGGFGMDGFGGQFITADPIPRCAWKGERGAGGAFISEWYDPLTPLNTCIIDWKLTITGASTATLTGYANPKSAYPHRTLIYNCSDFHCKSRSTFLKSVYPDTLFCDYPEKVCIIPGYTDFITPCSSAANVCNCCDDGSCTATFIVTIDCSNFSPYAVIATRNAPLPSGVSDPGGACGYFWNTFGVKWGLLVWCDGTNYKVQIYCLISTTYIVVCDTTATRDLCCPNFAIHWTCSNIVCANGTAANCCDNCGVPCECCTSPAYPRTLHLTITSSDCPAANGVVITLTNTGSCEDQGGLGGWLGSGTVDCASFSFRLFIATNTCTWRLSFNGGATQNLGSIGGATCPFTTVSGSWFIECPDCPDDDGIHRGQVTGTLTA